jgi:hypothetical protein
MKQVSWIIITLCLCITSITQADTVIYKWIDKDGVVSFSQNEPAPEQAHEVTKMTLQTMPESEQRAAKRMLSHLEKTAESSFAEHHKRLQQADEAIEAALKKLAQAEHNLATGSVPTGYDRVGNVNHKARLRESYFTRVEDLQDKVDQARQELSDAYAARDQVVPGSEGR